MKIKQIVFLNIIILTFSSCKKQDDLYSVENSLGPQIVDIVAFKSVSATQIDADNFSLCNIKVKINPETDKPNRVVKFRVLGSATFTNGDTIQNVIANTEGYASVSFKNAKVEIVQLKATVSNYSIDTTVNFTPALPDDMQLQSDSYILDAASAQSTIIRVKLFRNANRGVVSDGAKVNFIIKPTNPGLNLIYQGFQFSHAQNVTDTSLNPFKVLGSFDIEGNTMAADGTTLSKSIRIVIR